MGDSLKIKFYIIMALLIVIIFIVGYFVIYSNSMPKSGLIFIDNYCVDENSVTIYRKYAKLPLLKVLSEYDVSINWIDHDKAMVAYNNTVLLLSLEKMELVDTQTGNNFLLQVPGSKNYYCIYSNGELVVDDTTMHSVLYQMGIKTEILVDYKNSIVHICRT